MELKPDKCKCGANARVRIKGEYAWVECSNKKCNKHSGYIHFVCDVYDDEVKEVAMQQAVNLWNHEILRK